MQDSEISGKTSIETTHNHIDLKSLRESMGISLKDIFQQTRISVGTLEAIENGRFDLLPPPVFARSFIKTYARFLNIDETIILSQYNSYLESSKEKNQEVNKERISTFPHISYKVIGGVIFFLFVTSLVIFSLSSYQAHVDPVKNQMVLSPPIKEEGTISPSATPTEMHATTSSTTPIPSAPQKETSGTASEKAIQISSHNVFTGSTIQDGRHQEKPHQMTPLAEPYEVIIEAKELTWLRIITDEGSGQEFLLKPGEIIRKKGVTFHIDVGNAGGTDIRFQGKSLGILGTRGQVIHLKLP